MSGWELHQAEPSENWDRQHAGKLAQIKKILFVPHSFHWTDQKSPRLNVTPVLRRFRHATRQRPRLVLAKQPRDAPATSCSTSCAFRASARARSTTPTRRAPPTGSPSSLRDDRADRDDSSRRRATRSSSANGARRRRARRRCSSTATTTCSPPSRSSCGTARRSSRRCATARSSRAARSTTKASSICTSRRSRRTSRRAARCRSTSSSSPRARRKSAARTSRSSSRRNKRCSRATPSSSPTRRCSRRGCRRSSRRCAGSRTSRSTCRARPAICTPACYGGAVMNPAMALARILATMHDADGHIAIPGFYDKVRDWGDVARDGRCKQLPFDDEALPRRDGLAGAVRREGLSRRSSGLDAADVRGERPAERLHRRRREDGAAREGDGEGELPSRARSDAGRDRAADARARRARGAARA